MYHSHPYSNEIVSTNNVRQLVDTYEIMMQTTTNLCYGNNKKIILLVDSWKVHDEINCSNCMGIRYSGFKKKKRRNNSKCNKLTNIWIQQKNDMNCELGQHMYRYRTVSYWRNYVDFLDIFGDPVNIQILVKAWIFLQHASHFDFSHIQFIFLHIRKVYNNRTKLFYFYFFFFGLNYTIHLWYLVDDRPSFFSFIGKSFLYENTQSFENVNIWKVIRWFVQFIFERLAILRFVLAVLTFSFTFAFYFGFIFVIVGHHFILDFMIAYHLYCYANDVIARQLYC